MPPPWTYSAAFGGEYIYNPQTDTINLKDGRSLARPAHVTQASLSGATWTGNPGSPPPNAGYIHQAGQPTGDPARQQPALRAGMTPANTPRHMANAPRGKAPMRGGPATPAGGQMSGQNRRAYQEIIPRRETPVVFQTTTRSQVDSGRLRLPNAREPGINIGVESITSTLFPSFRARSHDFFAVGRVFQVLWSEPAGGTSLVTSWEPGIVLNQYKERVFSKVRRFVVVRAASNYCTALPINSYGGQGVAKPGVNKSEHVIVFSRGPEAPQPAKSENPRRGEESMQSVPIRIDPDSQEDHLDNMSRLNLAGVTTVHHNIKAKSVGRVNDRYLRALLDQFGVVFGTQQLPTPLTRVAPATTSGAAQGAGNDSDDDDDDDEDEDEDEDASDEGEDVPVVGQRVIRQQPLVLR